MAQTKRTPKQQPQAAATQPTEPAAESISSESALADDEQWRAIATAAYYKAQQRGFAPGNDMQDWLDAERELAGARGSEP